MRMEIRGFATRLLVSCVLLPIVGCSPVLVEGGAKGNTPQCVDMDETCAEAEQFRLQYAKVSDEEKKEMKEMLTGLESQCEESILRCKQSQKRAQ